jgi:hypothetical protein
MPDAASISPYYKAEGYISHPYFKRACQQGLPVCPERTMIKKKTGRKKYRDY